VRVSREFIPAHEQPPARGVQPLDTCRLCLMLPPETALAHPPGTTEPLAPYVAAAASFPDFLPTAQKHADLWHAVWDRAIVPSEFVERVEALPGRWHLLILSADWCGDAVNTVPIVARLAERARNLDVHVLDRDAFPELRDSHLTNGRSQSIPVVMVLDTDLRERAWWGPRPTMLQRWVMEEGLKLDPEERYKYVRRWYVLDRGVTTLAEVVGALEAAAAG